MNMRASTPAFAIAARALQQQAASTCGRRRSTLPLVPQQQLRAGVNHPRRSSTRKSSSETLCNEALSSNPVQLQAPNLKVQWVALSWVASGS